jgi:UDP-glucose 4-epimerase
VSHIDSLRDSHTDLDINCRSQLTLLEACRHNNPRAKVVYASTRQVYGRPDFLPVSEQHLVRPTDVNGINKVAGEYYHLVYNNVFGVRACSLRLTNVYGPRQLIKHSRQGFIGWFIRQAIEGAEIQIFGDGTQLRDFVFVEDAVDAFLRAGVNDACNGEVFNVGGGQPISHRALVTMLLEVAGHGSMAFVEWPADKKAIDIGSFYSSSAKFTAVTGWQPAVALRDGLARTIEFYRAHFGRYVPDEPAL